MKWIIDFLALSTISAIVVTMVIYLIGLLVTQQPDVFRWSENVLFTARWAWIFAWVYCSVLAFTQSRKQ